MKSCIASFICTKWINGFDLFRNITTKDTPAGRHTYWAAIIAGNPQQLSQITTDPVIAINSRERAVIDVGNVEYDTNGSFSYSSLSLNQQKCKHVHSKYCILLTFPCCLEDIPVN